MTSPLRDALRARLLGARRERDAVAVGALRTAIAAVENAEAVPVPAAGTEAPDGAVRAGATEVERRLLDAEDERRIVVAEAADLRSAEAQHRARGDGERARAAGDGAGVLEQVLAQAVTGGRSSA